MCQAPAQPEKGKEVVVRIDAPQGRHAGFSPFFTAISDVMLRAKRTKLDKNDLLLLHPSDDVTHHADALHASWERTVAQWREAKAITKPGDKKQPSAAPPLFKAMWPQLRGLYFRAFGFFIIAIVLSLLAPILLTWTIKLIEDTQQCGLTNSTALLIDGTQLDFDAMLLSDTPPPITEACRAANRVEMGYIYAVLMLLVKVLESVFRSWHDHTMHRVALRARVAIISAIYRKCLWLSGMGSDEATTGRIQNLMANDAQFFLQIAPMINNAFVAPVQIVVCFVWLAFLVGPAFLAGIAAMVLSVPCQFLVLKTYFKCQVKRLKLTDQRVKITNEMVQGIRVIKMYAWEQSIQQKMRDIRKQELACVRTQRFASSFLSVFMTTQPLFMTVATFSVYGAMEGELRASVVLPALALLGMLRLPIAFLPMCLMQLANLKVAKGRITKFLMNSELPDDIKQRSLDAELREAPAAIATAAGEIMAETPRTSSVVSGLISAASDTAVAVAELANEALSDSPEPVPPTSTPLESAPAARMHAAGGAITIRGSFKWQAVEVPAARGRGRGGRSGRGGPGRGSPRGGGGKGRWSFKSKKIEKGSSKEPATVTSDQVTSTGGDAELDKASTGTPGTPEGTAASDAKPTPPTLRQLSLSFPAAELTVIVGAVGSGKSSLLSALLGELRPAALAGEGAKTAVADVSLDGAVGYFSQTPFILNETLRGNILLGTPMDEKRYQRVLEACALPPDLAILPGGDMTQIGEKGINLSGGQKARVALARACYAGAPTVLLDDPLSAVDAHVGRHIFHEVLGPNGLLAGATRILVTHQTQYLPLADRVVLLDGGAVIAQGTYEELRNSDVDLSALSALNAETAADAPAGASPVVARRAGEAAKAGEAGKAGKAREAGEAGDGRSEKTAGDRSSTSKGSVLVKDEERATGSVSFATHLAYLRAMGGVPFGITLILAVAWDKFCAVSTDFWLAMWIDPTSSPLGRHTPAQTELGFWVPIYVAGLLAAGVSVYLRSVFFNVVMGLRAARVLYAQLSKATLAAPMIFFETTPSGRILNRFTSDIEQVDFQLLMQLAQWMNCISNVIGALVFVCVINPWCLAAVPVFMVAYAGSYYLSCSAIRDLQRLEAVTRSPIFTQFSETLNGLSTIRAFGATRRFEQQSLALVAENTRCLFNQDLANQWIAMRLDLCSASIAALTVALPICMLQFGSTLGTSPAAFGLCISYALDLSAFLKFGTKTMLEIQRGMAGVERIFEYTDTVVSEPTGGAPAPTADWPSSGHIVTSDMCVRYRPELPLALRNVSCTIAPKSKVGIVGRTGSGKTTFVSALWRLVEPTCGEGGALAGAITVDGTDISTLQLQALRSRLAIIVQDPVLFNDTIKYNLDPFGAHSDEAVRRVVSLVQLEAPIAALDKGLEAPVGEAGANFSVGQRQLICLARAMLRESKLIVLDEATASIDNETDAILQTTIRQTFADATVLTIAHRLHTIMDSTAVMLFDKGELKENAPPHELLEDDDSQFSRLVDDTGSAAAHLRSLAAEAAAKRAA